MQFSRRATGESKSVFVVYAGSVGLYGNNGDKRRNRKRDKASKRYKIRYDRLVAAVLVIVVLAVVLASCAHACSDKDKKKNSDTQKQTTSDTTEQQKSSIIDDLVTSSETSSLITGTPDGQKPSEYCTQG